MLKHIPENKEIEKRKEIENTELQLIKKATQKVKIYLTFVVKNMDKFSNIFL